MYHIEPSLSPLTSCLQHTKLRVLEYTETDLAHSYEFPRAALTVDCVVFGMDDQDLKVLLIERDLPPFEGEWALPGGFVHVDETLDEAARRELCEETGLMKVFLEQLYTFSALDRDPRERVISVAYYALVNLVDHRVQAATDAREAAWFSVDDVPTLAFDHAEVLGAALERLRGKLGYQPIGFELLPQKFTLSQLQHLYEVVLERELDKRNFRKKVLATGLLIETREVQQDVAHRAARLYRCGRTEVPRARSRRIPLRDLMGRSTVRAAVYREYGSPEVIQDRRDRQARTKGTPSSWCASTRRPWAPGTPRRGASRSPSGSGFRCVWPWEFARRAGPCSARSWPGSSKRSGRTSPDSLRVTASSLRWVWASAPTRNTSACRAGAR